jgi:hypothetical protein
MDQDTKEYIDKKFAEQTEARRNDQAKAQTFFAQRQQFTRRVVSVAAVIMLFLLAMLIGLLLWAQVFRAH